MFSIIKPKQKDYVHPLTPENKPQSLPPSKMNSESKVKIASLFTKQVKKNSDIPPPQLQNSSTQAKLGQKKSSLPDNFFKKEPSHTEHTALDECQNKYKSLNSVLEDRQAREYLKKFMTKYEFSHWLDFVIKVENLEPESKRYRLDAEILFDQYLDKNAKPHIPLHNEVVFTVYRQLENRKDVMKGPDLETLKACQRSTKDMITQNFFNGTPSFLDSKEFNDLIAEKMQNNRTRRRLFF